MLEDRDEVSCPWLRQLLHKKWFVLMMWQVCSIFLCAMGVVVTLISNMNGSTLTFLQLVLTYAMLALAHIWHIESSDLPLWKYVCVALLNSMGDGFSVASYSYTSLASSLLLTTTVVFWVVPLSYAVFRRKFSIPQLFSLVLGLGGMVLVFLADGTAGSRWKGNMFAVLSAMSFAGSTVLQEYLVHSASAIAYLCRFSMSATVISGVACGIFEYKQIPEYDFSWKVVLYMLLYALIQTIYYSMCPFIMQHSSAAEMNLSFLTSNFFSLLISILAFGQKASWLYLVGFFCIPIAIAIYSLFPPKEKNASECSHVEEKYINDSEEEIAKVEEEKAKL
ncbi:Integral membrane protein [Tritrichomonas foetus]|uniref:Integral membrane protein n=1 Tax=Tritrichomonas foetus TaxID=1144522 RepID=A0A1J4JF62_9EUKA|nr:Integral membrane protein [Tritrichomonas foetus]|eukprot:OHS97786.1 Integral membrane protein [Tritrichomonas foetus]